MKKLTKKQVELLSEALTAAYLKATADAEASPSFVDKQGLLNKARELAALDLQIREVK